MSSKLIRAAALGWEEVTQRQFGLISREQALALGLKEHHITWLIARRTWEVVFPSVYRVVAASRAWPQQLFAASLWAGPRVALSHRSAARLWDLDDYRQSEEVELTSRRFLEPPRGVTYHLTRKLVRGEIKEHHETGLVLTSVARTLYDLASLDSTRLERVIDEALRRTLVSINELEYVLSRNGVRGRKGAARFAAIVKDRAGGGATDSSLETDVLTQILGAGLASPSRQFRVEHEDHFIAQVDFAWRNERVAVQVHGPTIHRQRKTWENDQRVENKLTAAGWTVIKAKRELIEKHEAEFLAQLKRALTR